MMTTIPTGKRKATLTINDTSLDPVSTYNNITISKNTLNENGGTVELQVTGEHLTDGATVVATVSGLGITRSDFTAGSDSNSNLQMTSQHVRPKAEMYLCPIKIPHSPYC